MSLSFSLLKSHILTILSEDLNKKKKRSVSKGNRKGLFEGLLTALEKSEANFYSIERVFSKWTEGSDRGWLCQEP